ncbi:MAG: chorismate mutase [Spirochaetales bacterium]|jgi:chorismate mutase|nr:chorismate mutase [Spirochaetales bacterium]
MRVLSVRGAVQVAKDEPDLICQGLGGLVEELLQVNRIKLRRVINLQFSVTRDLVSLNPAAALRRRGDYGGIPLFCSQEPDYRGSLERVIRVLILFESLFFRTPRPLYRGGAEALRPDLAAGS